MKFKPYLFLLFLISILLMILESQSIVSGQPVLIQVFPVAGIPGADIRQVMAYYDHDPREATVFSEYGLGKNNILDYMGGENTYDGHTGTDFGVAGFEDQDIGIPVVAVYPGVVKNTRDGVFDRENEFREGVQGNFVLIDHGNGIMSYYNHLKKGSVCVKTGEKVRTGQQIGCLGSSGASTWPHLHFEWRENGTSIDPFSGPENHITSRWVNQPSYDYPMTITDCGLYYPENRKKLPFISIRETYVKRKTSKEKKLGLWITVNNVTKNSYTRRWKLVSPDKEYTNEWSDIIDGSEQWHGLGAEIWQYATRVSFSEKATRGIWTMEIYHDDILAKIVQFTVSDSEPENRIPEKPGSGKILPLFPGIDDYITCIIDGQLKTRDPDLDKIRYHYLWLLNGNIVRDVVSATRLDYFPADSAKPGDKLACLVSVSDGKGESESLEFKVTYKKMSE